MTTLLTTDRLLIRTWEECDRSALEQMTGDADMMHYLTDGRVWSADEINEFYQLQARHNICMGVLATRDDDADRGLQPLDDGTFELGWWVWKDHWGKGRQRSRTRADSACTRVIQLAEVFAVIGQSGLDPRGGKNRSALSVPEACLRDGPTR